MGGEVKSLQLFNPDSGLGCRVKKRRFKRGYSLITEKLPYHMIREYKNISGLTQIVELSSRPIKGKRHSIDDFQANAGLFRIQIKGFYICTDI